MINSNSQSHLFFNKVTILGVGLIGASFALALKKHRLCSEIIGYGRKEKNLRKAKERAIIDSFELDPAEACVGSDLIVFATPVGSFLDIAERARGSLKSGAIVTDVGSVKGKLVYDMEALMPEGIYFVGATIQESIQRQQISSAVQSALLHPQIRQTKMPSKRLSLYGVPLVLL